MFRTIESLNSELESRDMSSLLMRTLSIFFNPLLIFFFLMIIFQYALKLLYVSIGVGISAFVGMSILESYNPSRSYQYIQAESPFLFHFLQKDYVGQELQRDRLLG